MHFITASCYHRQPLLGTPVRRDLVLMVRERVRQKYRFLVLGYVVMPEHFSFRHLPSLLTNPSGLRNLSMPKSLKRHFRQLRTPTTGALRENKSSKIVC